MYTEGVSGGWGIEWRLRFEGVSEGWLLGGVSGGWLLEGVRNNVSLDCGDSKSSL